MKTALFRKKSGFTLVELIVVIAILVTVGGIAAVAIWSRVGVGDDQVCKENLEQLGKLGLMYGEDQAHPNMLPVSGMDDDEETVLSETDGWWVALAYLENCNAIIPTKKGGKLKLPEYFHCPLDARTQVDGRSFVADYKSVSYVSWTNRVNQCINKSTRIRLEAMPWLSDGNPVKGKSVTDLASFNKMVMPAVGKRHKGTVNVLYASGAVKPVEVTADMAPKDIFAAMAPVLAKPAKGKAAKHVEEEPEDDDSAAGADDTASDDADADDTADAGDAE